MKWLVECGQVEAEEREGKVGMRITKDGEEGWTPVVRRRRKRSARTESNCELEVDGEGQVFYKCLRQGVLKSIRRNNRQWDAGKPSHISWRKHCMV